MDKRALRNKVFKERINKIENKSPGLVIMIEWLEQVQGNMQQVESKLEDVLAINSQQEGKITELEAALKQIHQDNLAQE
eukprot:c51773_g1_i1 orf=322-558(+)